MLRDELLNYLELNPGANMRDLSAAFPDSKLRAIRACLGKTRRDGEVELRGYGFHLAGVNPERLAHRARQYGRSGFIAPTPLARLMAGR
jgi:hypothetical protein